AAHRDRAEGPDQLAEPGDAMRLDLRDEVHRARGEQADDRWVDPVEVVEREHDAARLRDAFRAVVAERDEQPDQRADRVAADRPDGVDAGHGVRCAATISSIRATTSSTARSVVSIWIASS